MLPTWPNDTPFRGKDCRESIFASGPRLALHAEARVEGIGPLGSSSSQHSLALHAEARVEGIGPLGSSSSQHR